MALASSNLSSQQFSFRIMKEVRALVLYGGGTEEDAVNGMIIALASMLKISESELRRRLNVV